MVTVSAMATTLFLGGWRAPWPLSLLHGANAAGGRCSGSSIKVLLVPVRLRLAARHAAPAALRPVHAARLEGAGPGQPGLDPGRSAAHLAHAQRAATSPRELLARRRRRGRRAADRVPVWPQRPSRRGDRRRRPGADAGPRSRPAGSFPVPPMDLAGPAAARGRRRVGGRAAPAGAGAPAPAPTPDERRADVGSFRTRSRASASPSRHVQEGRHRGVPGELPDRRRRATTAGTSSTGTRTGWRSASAASCAPGPARPTRSTSRAATTPRRSASRPGERYGAIYQINYLRCIGCGLCIEACPTRSLTMTNEYELADDNRQDLIFTKEQLLAPLLPGMEQPPHPMRLGDTEQDYYVQGPTLAAGRQPAPRPTPVGRAGHDELARRRPRCRGGRTVPGARRDRRRRRGRSPSGSSARSRCSARSAWCSPATPCTRRCAWC